MYLRDIVGTKYLTDDFESDVNYLLTKFYACKSTGTLFTEDIYNKRMAKAINDALSVGKLEIDLNDCRFTGKVWNVLAGIKEHQDDVHLFDSGDMGRDEFIKEFMAFVDMTQGIPKVSTLPPKPKDLAELANWVNQLDRNVVYQLFTEEYVKNPAFLLVINLLAPEVMIETRNRLFVTYAKHVFSKYMLESCKSFYYLYGLQEEFLVAHTDSNNMVYVPNIGEFDRETFIRKFLCMPLFVGNETVSFTNAPESLRGALREIMRDVKAYLDERPITIETYFPLKEVYGT